MSDNARKLRFRLDGWMSGLWSMFLLGLSKIDLGDDFRKLLIYVESCPFKPCFPWEVGSSQSNFHRSHPMCLSCNTRRNWNCCGERICASLTLG